VRLSDSVRLGVRLVDGVGLPESIAVALEAPSADDVTDPQDRLFRAFADQTKSDRKALAACIRGTRETLSAEQVAAIAVPTLIAVGTKDQVAGSPHHLCTANFLRLCSRSRLPRDPSACRPIITSRRPRRIFVHRLAVG
jgi:pimeloyl-ACP methyl ester carboxylesterase